MRRPKRHKSKRIQYQLLVVKRELLVNRLSNAISLTRRLLKTIVDLRDQLGKTNGVNVDLFDECKRLQKRLAEVEAR